MKKKLAIIAMTILIMTGVCGCADRHEKNNEEMLAHMQEKYGVEFEIRGYVPRNVDCSYDVWYCNAVNDEEQESIEVHRYYGELAEDGEYADTYYTRLVRDEVERRALEAVLQVTDEAKVYLSNYDFAAEEYTKLEQLDEFLHTKEGQRIIGIIVYIVDRENDGIKNQEVIDKVEKALLEAGVGNPWVRALFVKTDELFGKINRKSQDELVFGPGEDKIYTDDYSGGLQKGLEK